MVNILKTVVVAGVFCCAVLNASIVGFATNYDIIHRTDITKNTTISDLLDDDDVFDRVVDNIGDYYIEYAGKKYSLAAYDRKWSEIAGRHLDLVTSGRITDKMIFGVEAMLSGVNTSPLDAVNETDDLEVTDIL